VVALISAASAYFFWQMPDDAGHGFQAQGDRDLQPQRRARPPAPRSETTRTRGIKAGIGSDRRSPVRPGRRGPTHWERKTVDTATPK